jgi:hypothetical protein
LEEERARRLTQPQPPGGVISIPAGNDDKATDDAIRRLGEEVRKQGNQPVQTRGEPPSGEKGPTARIPDRCPQHDNGCVALLLNFRTYAYASGVSDSEEPDELGAVAKALGGLPCDVTHVEPDVKRMTSYDRGYYIGIKGHGYHYTKQIDPKGDEFEHNKQEMQKLTAAIERHRATVKAKQPELAIEMISAHGHYASFPGETFGFIGPHIESASVHVDRGRFHSGNYDAAKHNVCQWLVYDSSCYSGLTPRAVDTLNNTGKANYTPAASDKCELHAAYDMDLGAGTATADTCAWTTAGPKILDDTVLDALRTIDAHRRGHMPGFEPDFLGLVRSNREKFPSRYYDAGYKTCVVMDRTGYDFYMP